jgi:hypothetical protein
VAFSRPNCIRSSSSISFGFAVISFSIAGFYRDSVFHAHEGLHPCWPVHNLHDVVWEGFLLWQMVLIPPFVQQIELESHQSQSCLRAELSLKNIYIYLHEYWEVPERSVLGSARGSVGTSSSGSCKIPLNIPSSSLVTCSWITCKSRDSVNSLHKVR